MTTVIAMNPIANTSVTRLRGNHSKSDRYTEHCKIQYMRKNSSACKRKNRGRIVFSTLLYICALIGIITCLNTAMRAFAADVRTTEPNSRSQYTSILVQPGDTLISIAQTHMSDDFSSTNEYARYIQEINHMDDDLLVAGNHIVIPIADNK